ncbi:MAG: NAD(P)/FAD-dependent oxidoreductase [Pseudomonadota bacterium]|nr:NAD(P)/FAD-dependent oxidoreductase [Pseudomonadota bacterium]
MDSIKQDSLGFNPDELRQKYRLERDKRVRVDGNDQYLEVKGDFSYFVEDPYIDEEISRDSLEKTFHTVIIGGGFGGVLSGARLREQGIDDFRIIEKGGDFGGTWYWNRYPGASCDIESYIYFPLLEETSFIPKRKYTDAAETLDYFKVLSDKFSLKENALFQTEVNEVKWISDEKLWFIKTNRQDSIKARYVIHANGFLNRPKLPAMKGINDYQGHTFHTSRWDYAYTGGNSNGNLNNLRDKNVAIIGTGATAVQCVPHLAAGAKKLYVFQRTPSSIDERNNSNTDIDWFNSQKSGWQKERKENFEGFLTGNFTDKDLVNDGWTEIFRTILGGLIKNGPSKLVLLSWVLTAPFYKNFYKVGLRTYIRNKFMNFVTREDINKKVEIVDFQKMEKVRARADALVNDPKTAESLKPYYRQLCKRPCFHDEYLQAFNNDNVELIDTDGQGVKELSAEGIIHDGKEYKVDCIIFASGFEVGTDYSRRCGYQVSGIDGITLSEKWKDGLATFHGIHSKGFPNSFFYGPGQGPMTANFTHSLDEQSAHVAYILKQLDKKNMKYVEASEEAESDWINTIISKARNMQSFQEACTPGYYNNEGKPNTNPANNTYGGGALEYFKLLKDWRKNNKLQGLKTN